MNKQKLLETKVLIPEIRKDYESREKLLSKLNASDKKLLVLRATIGCGKTVLLAQFARLTGNICAWYHLDSLDNKLITFIRYLVLSLDRALDGFIVSEELYSEAESENGNQLWRILLTNLEEHLNHMESQRLVLVMDDFQVLKNPEILKLMEELLDYTDHRFMLAISTRGDIPGSFAKYFMRHQGIIVGADCLSFWESEVRSILDKMLPEKSAEQYTQIIWKNTKGWPAGVMLSAQYLRRLGNCISDISWEQIYQESWIQNYITYELYKRLPYDIQRFLLYTSFAGELNSGLCDYICQIKNSEDILQYLWQENIFMKRADGNKRCYRYHPLFQSFLKNKAGAELSKVVDKRISDYYLKFYGGKKGGGYEVLVEKDPQKDRHCLLKVSCFGEFRVVIARTGKEISWRTRKALELFAYLVDLEGKPVERRVLLERLWPDNAPINEVAMLHNMIYNIRKELSSEPELAGLIQYKGHRYYLDRSLIKADLDNKKEICHLAETGNVKELYEHREELLSNWGVYLKEVDGTWCMSRRTYFERTYGKACSLLADYCRKNGDLETEAACWTAYMEADRYSEEAVAGLLRCYADMGERHQMQRVFESAKKIFNEEIGIEISPEIVRIFEQGMRNVKKIL